MILSEINLAKASYHHFCSHDLMFPLPRSIIITSNSNHRLNSAVDMAICVLKRRGLVWVKSENEPRFSHLIEVIFARQRNKMAANLDLFRMHLHRHPNANQKLDLRSPIVDRNIIYIEQFSKCDFFLSQLYFNLAFFIEHD